MTSGIFTADAKFAGNIFYRFFAESVKLKKLNPWGTSFFKLIKQSYN